VILWKSGSNSLKNGQIWSKNAPKQLKWGKNPENKPQITEPPVFARLEGNASRDPVGTWNVTHVAATKW